MCGHKYTHKQSTQIHKHKLTFKDELSLMGDQYHYHPKGSLGLSKWTDGVLNRSKLTPGTVNLANYLWLERSLTLGESL